MDCRFEASSSTFWSPSWFVAVTILVCGRNHLGISRYMNSLTWGSESLPTQRAQSTVFQQRTMALDLKVLTLIPIPGTTYSCSTPHRSPRGTWSFSHFHAGRTLLWRALCQPCCLAAPEGTACTPSSCSSSWAPCAWSGSWSGTWAGSQPYLESTKIQLQLWVVVQLQLWVVCSAIKDTRRFNYVVRLLELIAKSKLPSLSGVAQKNYMNILERVVQKVLDDQQNVRPIKELLQTLYVSLCGLVQGMGKSVLVGNINTWLHRMENILQWHQQLDNIQINRPTSTGMSLTDLPASLQLNIMQRVSDGRDLVSLGQVCPELGVLAEDRLLWKRLCQYHFTDRQIRKRLMVSDKGQLEWKKMYFKLSRCYPHREEYSDTLYFCTHCHILFWKDTNHPCTANNPDGCTMSLSPQDFINLFNF